MRIVVLCPGLTESPVLESLKSEESIARPEELMEAMKDIKPQRLLHYIFSIEFLD